MIEVGLIGFGLAGRAFHAPVIRAVPGMHLAAILQRTGNEAAEKYPDIRIVRSLEELLAIEEIRLAVIATPNDTHYSLARQCLEAGRLITVYQNRRYDGDFQAIRKLVTDGTLGRIVRFETNYDRYRPQLKPGAWRETRRAGSGILFDIAPHLIDHALVLFGLPEAVRKAAFLNQRSSRRKTICGLETFRGKGHGAPSRKSAGACSQSQRAARRSRSAFLPRAAITGIITRICATRCWGKRPLRSRRHGH